MAYMGTGVSLRDGIHTDSSTGISGWNTHRTALTGEFTRNGGNISGRYGEFSKDIQEYNRKIDTLSGAWHDTGMFLTPYNAGFRYTGTGDFNKWDTYSVDFDGTDDYIRGLEDATVLDFIHTGAALSFWINLDAFPCTTQSGEQYWGNTGDFAFAYKAFFTGFRGTNCWMALQGASKVSTDVSSYITAGTWHHICMVADAGTATYYIDGIARDTMSYTPDAADNPDAGHFDIAMAELFPTGIPAGPMPSGWVAGKFDEVAIFKGALSAAQVLAIYNGGTPQSLAPYNPFAWWRMGDGPLDDGNRSGNGLIGDQVNPTLGSETITNGTFETNLDNWTESTTPTLVTWERNTTSPIAGNADAHAVGNASSNFAGVASNGISLVDGKTYKVTFKYRKSGTVKLKIGQSTSPTGSKVSGTTEPTLTATTNDTFTYYFRPTQTVTGYVIFYLYIDAELYVDDVSLKEVNGNAGLMDNMTASDIVADTP